MLAQLFTDITASCSYEPAPVLTYILLKDDSKSVDCNVAQKDVCKVSGSAYAEAILHDQVLVTLPLNSLPLQSGYIIQSINSNTPTLIHNISHPGQFEDNRAILGIRKYEPYVKHTGALPWKGASSMINDDTKAEYMLNLAINVWKESSKKLLYYDEESKLYYEFQATDRDRLIYHEYRNDDVSESDKRKYKKFKDIKR
ncbi:hypothetical protein [Bifidobacterium callitrichos]|uniref:hypothetical protein n=1 Tax=Bifidobacterium callitrichos TaxID=762209 RepID=UPI0011B1C76C|nr:hypothetical protein [Bifidobacterium callitrichos]